MITGNKGEWSEIYTLFKILADRQLNAGDGNLNKIENLIFPIIKVLRDESSGTFEFSYEDNLVLIKNDKETRIPIIEFQKQAAILLEKLQDNTGSSFAIPEIEDFLKSFNTTTLKAKSTIKSDIRIVIHDQRTGTNPELGFSIKSQLGGSSTLLNAGRTTNFIYRINNVDNKEDFINLNKIDGNRKIQKRIEGIINLNGDLEFFEMENNIFEGNLILIDSALPLIISEIILLFFTTNLSSVSDLTKKVTTENPLQFNVQNNHPFYAYKLKRLLTDIALGMTPATVWDGKLDATGGYLVVKKNGDIICYHIYNQNEFEDYLFNNTKLETASSTRHNFGTVYEKSDELFINLNLQIRFMK